MGEFGGAGGDVGGEFLGIEDGGGSGFGCGGAHGASVEVVNRVEGDRVAIRGPPD